MAESKPTRKCSIEGCDRSHYAKDLCSLHYSRLRKNGDPMIATLSKPKLCSIDGCENKHQAKGYCQKHYLRYKKWGNAMGSAPKPERESCVVDGCSNFRDSFGYCAKHKKRIKKYGSPFITQVTPPETKRQFVIDGVKNAEKSKCIIWPFPLNPAGYGYFATEGKRWMAHRYALFLHTGINPSDKSACHGKCHNPACINPHHLRWGTHQENMNDKYIDGTINRGCRHGMVKLTEKDVLAIRRDSRKQEDIALDYGVSRSAINDIRNRHTWKWLKDDAA